MSNKPWIIVGLGNPGSNFHRTRHNTGFWFLDSLVPAQTVWQTAPHYTFCTLKIAEQNTILLKPQTMMNLSGIAVQAALKAFQADTDQLIVVCDNSDLGFGLAKTRNHLATSGHNGLKNIYKNLQESHIKTIHFGIGNQRPLYRWVLSRFTTFESQQLPNLFDLVKQHLINFWQTDAPFERKWDLQKPSVPKLRTRIRRLVVVGGQFGDEGKGKIVDYYAAQFGVVARFSGGDNAGHTVKITDQTYHFSILPVAMLRADKTSFLGPGCLINLTKLCAELRFLQQSQIPPGKLRIAARAHLILPYHLLLDQNEEAKRATPLGTTKRGIGPCMADKVNRLGIQVLDLFDPATVRAKLARNLQLKNPLIKTPLKLEPLLTSLMECFAQIRPLVVDSVDFWMEHSDQNVLFEGAQGTLLDVQYGLYPFVTSTPTITWQAGLGTIHNVQKATFLGVFKSYISRVGAGPLPTLITDRQIHKALVQTGHEYGVVTQRERRLGWFDAVLARYAIKVNNFHQIALTLLDVLAVCDRIKICTHYLIRGKRYDYPPIQPALWTEIEPQYTVLSGWNQTDFRKITSYEQLPQNAKNYVSKIEQLLAIPVVLVSIGKERQATLKRY